MNMCLFSDIQLNKVFALSGKYAFSEIRLFREFEWLLMCSEIEPMQTVKMIYLK